jgi:hypothetical protein
MTLPSILHRALNTTHADAVIDEYRKDKRTVRSRRKAGAGCATSISDDAVYVLVGLFP